MVTEVDWDVDGWKSAASSEKKIGWDFDFKNYLLVFFQETWSLFKKSGIRPEVFC